MNFLSPTSFAPPAAGGGGASLDVGSTRLNSSLDMLRYNSATVVTGSVFSLCGWIKFIGTTQQGFFALDTPGSPYIRTNMYIPVSSNDVTLYHYNTTDGASTDTAIYTVITNNWHFFSAVWDGTDVKIRISDEFGSFTTHTKTVATPDGASDLFMGTTSSYWANWLDGELSLCRAWNAELSLSEIEAERESATPVRTSNIFGDWRAAAASTVLDDSSGNSNDFDTIGGAGWVDGDGLNISE